MSGHLIVVDWGTSNFRAFLVDSETGTLLDERTAATGIRALSTEEFPHYCARALQGWREGHGRTPVYLAGMVGSKRGWAESPQPSLPLDLAALASQVIPAPGLDDGWLLPGVKIVDPDGSGLVDVMRGEEIQIFGALALAATPDGGDCCAPGSHSKWARVEDGKLTRFLTAMTGELYHAVRFHTLPGEPAREESEFDEPAFRLGLERAGGDGGVLHALFEARSRHLYAGLGAEQVASFISGALIGEEVRAMHDALPEVERLNLIGAPALLAPYAIALEHHGIQASSWSARDATLAGVRALAARHQRIS
ncbi:2-dehydro-3-deoxygalactonokinase [Halotalea alkalilenta]|uniref:2-keto-3-deoxy-galactonokinase n=1 Tax=Halotalea alkalilenta TaxID=376489 RepID=A0A172YAP2_9GAMM|nr:2-dehydro-3-deoxygalactonokinase [Halotalea alkalilenta]ANF56290.1 2-keto-3-deoxy-galactonokinase [Halotalea alkalilenta]